ncbi:conjugal transfer protein, partial [Streptomonospora algeriensis]
MDLPTYTNIWRIEKKLYKLYDFRLPQPVSVVYIGVVVGVGFVWVMLLRLIGVPFEMPLHVIYIVPPFVIAFLATRPVVEGKRLSELISSQARYLAEPKAFTRLRPEREPGTVEVTVRVWHRDPQAGPLPEATGAADAPEPAPAADREPVEE